MYVLGIRPDEAHPGYQRFILEPHAGHFDSACGEIESPYGRIAAEWKKSDNSAVFDEKSSEDGPGDGTMQVTGSKMPCEEYIYHVIIPENTTAVLRLPGKQEAELGSGEYCFTMPAL